MSFTSEFIFLITVVYEIYLVFTFLVILLDNREPSETIAWLFLFIIFPVVGFLLYLLFGRNWRKYSSKKKILRDYLKKDISSLIEYDLPEESPVIQEIMNNSDKRKLYLLLHKNSSSFLTNHNQVQIYHHGKEKFDQLKEDIKKATKFIHMQYFIFRSDALGEEIKDLLVKKAEEGVEVRILYDYFGGMWIKRRFLRDMRKAGIEIYAFFNFLSLFKFHTLNYRNHRKIVVIDGEIAYCGGMNIGQEYLDGGKLFSSWRDTHMRIKGESVPILQSVFLFDWLNTTDQKLFQKKYFPKPEETNELPMQVTTSGPDSEWPSIKQLYFSAIGSANKSVYIVSPYFVPDPTILMVLKTAALSGLDVKLIMAGNPDGKLAYWSAFSYFEEILRSGVKLYHYYGGFLHAKMLIVDGEVCSLGTANLDIRSFDLNYEVNTLIYDEKICRDLQKQFEKDLVESREFTIKDYQKMSHFIKLRNSLARLLAPIL